MTFLILLSLIFNENVCSGCLMVALLIVKQIISVAASGGLQMGGHFAHGRIITSVSNKHNWFDDYLDFWEWIHQGVIFIDFFFKI